MNWDNHFIEFSSSFQESNTIRNFRKKALEVLKTLEIPNSSIEEWRKINLKDLSFGSLKDFHSEMKQFYQIEFHEKSSLNVIQFLNEMEENNEILKVLNTFLLKKLEEEKNNFFTIYNLTFFFPGIVVDLNQASSVFHLTHILKDYTPLICPLIIFRTEEGIKVNIVEEFDHWKNFEEKILLIGNSYLVSSNESIIQYISLENFPGSVSHFRSVTAETRKDGETNLFHFSFGGLKGKTFLNSKLLGKGGRSTLNGISILQNREFQDLEGLMDHEESFTDSSIRFKVITDDFSHHVFTGNLRIPSNLKHVTAKQINNNILRSNTSRAESIPKLEIFSESVNCEHGATVGELDEEQLFYLIAKGLSEEEAKEILLKGFLIETLDLLFDETIKNKIENIIYERIKN